MSIGGSFLRVKLSGHEHDRSLPSTAQVKNHCRYPSAPHICHHGVYRVNLTFSLSLISIMDILSSHRGRKPIAIVAFHTNYWRTDWKKLQKKTYRCYWFQLCQLLVKLRYLVSVFHHCVLERRPPFPLYSKITFDARILHLFCCNLLPEFSRRFLSCCPLTLTLLVSDFTPAQRNRNGNGKQKPKIEQTT